MMEQRLSLITLGVEDLARSTAFYEALGWKRGFRAADDVSFFQLGSVILSLWSQESLADDAGVAPRIDGGFRGVALAHNVREREEVDAVVAALEAAGGTVTKPPEEKVWGFYGAYVADPDGHLWEIAWNPSFAIDADGGIRLPD
jgi:uncharacterized protein